jgi:hypothetical protein
MIIFPYSGHYILLDRLLSPVYGPAHGTTISQLAVIPDKYGGEHVCFRGRWSSDTADTVQNASVH